MEKVSVIVPVYKVEKYLDKCVQSIVNQTYKNLEIILVDDGSPDNCPQICDEWAKMDSRIKVIHKENGGVSSARNRGLDEATGNYIGFVDSDDWIEPDMYEFLIDMIKEANADISRCSYSINDISSHTEVEAELMETPSLFNSKEEILVELSKSGYKSGILVNKLYKKEILENARFDLSLKAGEDTYFNYQVMKNSEKMICHDLPKYHYLIHNSNTILKNDLNYYSFLSANKMVADADCPNEMFLKFFMFGCMTLHDIFVNELDVDFFSVRKMILEKRKQIYYQLFDNKEYVSVLKLLTLRINSNLYKKIIVSNYHKKQVK